MHLSRTKYCDRETSLNHFRVHDCFAASVKCGVPWTCLYLDIPRHTALQDSTFPDVELLANDTSEGSVWSTLQAITNSPIDLVFSDVLNALELKRYCCRRMVLTHVDLIEKLLHYNRASLIFFSHIHFLDPFFFILYLDYSVAMERTKDKQAYS